MKKITLVGNLFLCYKYNKTTMERLNPRTIVNEEIQDIELILKKANELIRLHNMEGDFQ